jgi:hypothetical protein
MSSLLCGDRRSARLLQAVDSVYPGICVAQADREWPERLDGDDSGATE